MRKANVSGRLLRPGIALHILFSGRDRLFHEGTRTSFVTPALCTISDLPNEA
jgi:hypothetical protein